MSFRPDGAFTSDLALQVEGLGKMYNLYKKPIERLKHTLFWRFGKNYGHPFWALKDISFSVRRGETFGIIGRNGSGKSTLLQILANILQETTGKVWINGRVAALLELGSGFNPEFTGRENILLNGMILGISRQQMLEKFDEIAAFADIGEFIDQPIKLYSSGMFVRLAFAVAANVDADILLIDEALAVGDVFFRQKCYQRLQALREKGATIILVSHAMTEVEQFCEQALLLNDGQAIFLGSAVEAVKRYYLLYQHDQPGSFHSTEDAQVSMSEVEKSRQPALRLDDFQWPDPEAFFDLGKFAQVSGELGRCTGVSVCNNLGEPCTTFQQGETAVFYYEFSTQSDIEVPTGGLSLYNDHGIIVHGKTTLEYGTGVPAPVPAGCKIRFRQAIVLDLAIGEYTFEVGFATLRFVDYAKRSSLAHEELYSRIKWICTVSNIGPLAVVFRRQGYPVQLLHHGVANLPGECQAQIVRGTDHV